MANITRTVTVTYTRADIEDILKQHAERSVGYYEAKDVKIDLVKEYYGYDDHYGQEVLKSITVTLEPKS